MSTLKLNALPARVIRTGTLNFNVNAGETLKITGNEEQLNETIPQGKLWKTNISINITEDGEMTPEEIRDALLSLPEDTRKFVISEPEQNEKKIYELHFNASDNLEYNRKTEPES